MKLQRMNCAVIGLLLWTAYAAGVSAEERPAAPQPVRQWVIYLLPHSHVDIGYTHVQTDVERAHWRYYEQAIEASRRTADYPAGAQFKWNVEVLWATDSYLKQASPEKQREFIDAVKKGWIGLQALYGNELTALCRPEELVRLVEYAGRVGQRCGVPVDTAMISDVPGYTWGLMSVFAGSGVKYLSIGPNGGDRIGWTLAAWADKPFYWTAPDGKSKVLCWIPEKGYWQAFNTQNAEQQIPEMLRRMEAKGYPYDMIQIRYCLGDNAGPGVGLSELVKDWNAKHAYPKLIIATASEMMREMERRYGDKIPEVRGDFTPYWEDGAASSARETALNRAAAERLSQAEALWAVSSPKTYPADEFYAAWRNVILYDEHTWGAHCSISQPDSPFTKSQWAIKQAFALDADQQSRKLLERAAAPVKAGKTSAVMVYNTASWPRTDLVAVPPQVAAVGNVVKGSDGKQIPSQRLSTGELVFLAGEVPAFGAVRFTVEAGGPAAGGDAKADRAKLSTAALAVRVDEKTGGIASLSRQGIAADLVDTQAGLGLNDYFYVLGSDSKNPKRNGPVQIKAKERGPLVASLMIEADAPGCRKLTREIRVIDGLDRVDLINTVDKEKVRSKEGVHFGFAFNVPEGVVRMDIPWAVVRPEEDQMPGACKNWFTVQRWVDVSNRQYGVTLATIDAPLIDIGSLTADRIGSLSNPKDWIEHLKPSQTLYSWVMNNHWHTNYRADQEGPTVFRYALRPHAGGYSGTAAARFGVEQSQPLVAMPAAADAPARIASRLRVDSDDVLVATLKPSNDGKAWILRLFGASGKSAKATLAWAEPAPKTVCLSNLAEQPQAKADGPVEVPAYGIVTLRAER